MFSYLFYCFSFRTHKVHEKKLYLKVLDIYQNNACPIVFEDSTLKEVILEITSNRLGATAVLNTKNELVGIITDGDLRRMLNKTTEFNILKASEIMGKNPKTINAEEYAVEALLKMQDLNITQLLVVNEKNVLGFVHLHDLLKEGLI